VPRSSAGGNWTDSLVAEVERRLHEACRTSWTPGAGLRGGSHSHRPEAHARPGIDAATRLGVGRNTITRKIQELQLED